MTDLDALEPAAAPGPWTVLHESYVTGLGAIVGPPAGITFADAVLVTLARAAVPDLLAQLRGGVRWSSGAELEAVERALQAGTPAPWPIIGGGEYLDGIGLDLVDGVNVVRYEDAEFLSAAVDSLPTLLAQVRALGEASR